MPYAICDAFLGCRRAATTVITHPTLGEVQSCSDCAENLALVGLATKRRPLADARARQLTEETR